MRSIWTGKISFDYSNEAVAIAVDAPVSLYKARESHDISFRQIAPDGFPISQKRVDSAGNEVAWGDIRKGYEVDEDVFLLVPEEALENLMPEASKTITLTDFVDSVDPIYFENTYFVGVDKKADKTTAPARYAEMCALIGDRIAVGSFVYRQRQHTIALRQQDGHLYLSTLYYEDEVRESPSIPAVDVSTNRIALFDRIGAALVAPLDMSKYHDHYTDAVQSLISTLAAGGEYVAPVAAEKAAPVSVDDEALMAFADALEAAQNHSAVKTGIPGEKKEKAKA